MLVARPELLCPRRGRGRGRGRGHGLVHLIRQELPVTLFRCLTKMLCLLCLLIVMWSWARESRSTLSGAINILPWVVFGMVYGKFLQTCKTKDNCKCLTLFNCFEANISVLTITIRSMKCLQTSRVRIVCWQLSSCERVRRRRKLMDEAQTQIHRTQSKHVSDLSYFLWDSCRCQSCCAF